MLFRTDGHAIDLRDMYRGGAAFFLGGGPSLLNVDFSVLNARGVLTCAVNNVGSVFRPHLWVSGDDPGHFVDAIWRDPGILKFVPCTNFERQLIIRTGDGLLERSNERVADMPAVFGFCLNEAFCPERWLIEDSVNWGNGPSTADPDGNRGCRSVMLAALRILFYLGIRRVYLLGCDFRMSFGRQNYAFRQERSRPSIQGNNASYRILNRRFIRLKPYFDAAGFKVFNCTPNSRLAAFPFMQLSDALHDATAKIPQTIVTDGMYDRLQREKEAGSQRPNQC